MTFDLQLIGRRSLVTGGTRGLGAAVVATLHRVGARVVAAARSLPAQPIDDVHYVAAERRLGVADKLAAEIADHRDPARVVHALSDILRARILAIACGYEDADDLDHLRRDPVSKLACGRLPDSGRDLCSQPTMSRWENAPRLRRSSS